MKRITLPGPETNHYTQEMFEKHNEEHEKGVHNFISSIGNSIAHHEYSDLIDIKHYILEGIDKYYLRLPDNVDEPAQEYAAKSAEAVECSQVAAAAAVAENNWSNSGSCASSSSHWPQSSARSSLAHSATGPAADKKSLQASAGLEGDAAVATFVSLVRSYGNYSDDRIFQECCSDLQKDPGCYLTAIKKMEQRILELTLTASRAYIPPQ